MNRFLIHFLKLFLAAGILYWLIQNDKLELRTILSLFSNFVILVPVLIILIFQIFITSIRWKILLESSSKKSYKKTGIFLIQWIGQFFSVALPGVITGDIIKLVYVKRIDDSLSKKFLLFTVFLDRFMGLVGLLIISNASSLIFYNQVVGHTPEIKKIIVLNFLLLIFCLLVSVLFFLPEKYIDWINGIIKFKKINDILERFKNIRINKTTFIKLIAISSFSQVLAVIAFDLINQSFYETSIQLQDLFTIIPLGQVAVAIPLSPAGIGVGHLAYQKLFSFINQPNGAVLFNNFWVVVFVANVLGVIPYIFFNMNKKSKS